MKIFFRITICLFLCALTSCASQKTASWSEGSLTIDAAITAAAGYFTERLPEGANVALVHFDAPSGRLSDYIFDELWKRFEDSQNFIMVDRRNLERIEAEIKHQYETGRVSDETMVSITGQHGAQILVHGQINALGPEFRITIYATDVEKASSSQRSFIVRPDSRLNSLLNVSAEEEVDRAVSAMARAVNQKTTIAVGRITYTDTQTVSSLSAWLKNSIITNAQKQRDKFQVATESESSDFAVATRGLSDDVTVASAGSVVQAVVTGNYSPLDAGAEVSIQLISTSGNRVVLASERFIVSASELERRKLSLLPEKGNEAITRAEFEAKQQAVGPYAGKDNKWIFTVTPDVLDGIYYDGDFMSMRVYSAQDCYFRIIHVDVNGDTQIIYPVSPGDNYFIRAGETRRIPDNTRYLMGPPFGEELILAAAYNQPFILTRQSGPLSAESVTRNMTVQSETNAPLNPSATTKFSYTILPR